MTMSQTHIFVRQFCLRCGDASKIARKRAHKCVIRWLQHIHSHIFRLCALLALNNNSFYLIFRQKTTTKRLYFGAHTNTWTPTNEQKITNYQNWRGVFVSERRTYRERTVERKCYLSGKKHRVAHEKFRRTTNEQPIYQSLWEFISENFRLISLFDGVVIICGCRKKENKINYHHGQHNGLYFIWLSIVVCRENVVVFCKFMRCTWNSALLATKYTIYLVLFGWCCQSDGHCLIFCYFLLYLPSTSSVKLVSFFRLCFQNGGKKLHSTSCEPLIYV